MKMLKLALASLLLFIIAGCAGGYFNSDYSAKVTVKDGTVIECPDGIWINSSFAVYVRCYKLYGYEDINFNLVAQIFIDRKEK
ncbi:MAG: hypothetical protein Q8L47_05265 [bacterium]|nr:hypothetical protein [bacterium]